MPTYEYKCEACGDESTEKLSMADYDPRWTPVCLADVDDGLGKTKPCGGHTRRVFSPPSVSIK